MKHLAWILLVAGALLALWLALAQRGSVPKTGAAEVVQRPAVALEHLPPAAGLADPARASQAIVPAREALAEEEPLEDLPSATLEVLVQDQGGAAIAGVTLSFHALGDGAEGGSWRETRLSDAAGRSALAVPVGRALRLTCSASAEAVYHRSTIELLEPFRAGEARRVTVVLQRPRGAFHGLALAAEDDAPLAGIEVHARAPRERWQDGLYPDRDPGPATTRTDAQGRFSLSLEQWGDGRAVLRGADRSPRALVIDDSRKDPSHPLRVRLTRAATILGLVSGIAERPEPTVVARGDTYRLLENDTSISEFSDLVWTAAVDERGEFALRGLPPGVPLDLALRSERTVLLREPAGLVLDPGEERRVEWRVGSGATLEARAVGPSGTIEPGVELSLYAAEETHRRALAEVYWIPTRKGTSDERGLMVFEQIGAGSWAVAPTPVPRRRGEPMPEDAVAPSVVFVEVGLGDGHISIDVPVHRGLALAGRVVDPSRVPVPRYTVAFRSLEGPSYGAVPTDASGRFELGPLAPGPYQVYASGNARGDHAPAAPVLVEAGARDIELLAPFAGHLRAHLVDASTGESLPGIASAHAADGGRRAAGRSRSAEPALLGGLAGGPYHVVGTSPGGLFGVVRDVTVHPGETSELDVPLERGGELAISYRGPGAHVSYALEQDGVRLASGALTKGTTATVPAPLGPLEVVFIRFFDEWDHEQGQARRDEHRRAVVVTPDARADVHLELAD